MATLGFLFINIGIITVAGMLLVVRYLEGRENKQIAKVLEVVEAPVEKRSVVNLLRDLKARGEVASGLFSSIRNIAAVLEARLQQADLLWPVSRLVRLMAAGAVFGLAASLVIPFAGNGLLKELVFTGSGAMLPYLYVSRLAGKRLAKMEAQLPDALDFLARSMRGGHAFIISVGIVGNDLPEPLGREFRTLFNEQNMGASLETAFASFRRRVPLQDVNLFCSAATLTRLTGGNLAEILARLAELVRDRFRLRGQVRAASAHGKMTAGILMALPILTMFGLIAVAPGYMQGMWDDSDGRNLLYGAVAAQLLGNAVIRKIIRIKV